MSWFPETITLEFGQPQTELERARAHMRACQEDLRRARIWDNNVPWRNMQKYEDNFLASLSWLWDAQEREIANSAIPIDVHLTVSVQEIKEARNFFSSLPMPAELLQITSVSNGILKRGDKITYPNGSEGVIVA